MSLEQIRKALDDRNLAEVGRRLNITRSYLQAIRSGKMTPSKDTQDKLREYLESIPCN